jgi:hypothetical protein
MWGGNVMVALEFRPMVFDGSTISPAELLDLAEFATPDDLSDATRDREVGNLAEWCDHDPTLARHAARLARGRSARSQVTTVLDELASRAVPRHRLAATA